MFEWCYWREEALCKYSRRRVECSLEQTFGNLPGAGMQDRRSLRSVCVCVCVCVSFRLDRSGDSGKDSLEQFPKVCKLIRGLGFRV